MIVFQVFSFYVCAAIVWFAVYLIYCGIRGTSSASAGTGKNISSIKAERITKASNCFGRIQVVDSNADFKVRITKSSADLRVLQTPVAEKIGEWNFVDVSPDYTVRFVSANEDFSITFSSSPGLN